MNLPTQIQCLDCRTIPFFWGLSRFHSHSPLIPVTETELLPEIRVRRTHVSESVSEYGGVPNVLTLSISESVSESEVLVLSLCLISCPRPPKSGRNLLLLGQIDHVAVQYLQRWRKRTVKKIKIKNSFWSLNQIYVEKSIMNFAYLNLFGNYRTFYRTFANRSQWHEIEYRWYNIGNRIM